MAGADNRSYVKHAIAGLLALTVAPSAGLAESKFLSLLILACMFGWASLPSFASRFDTVNVRTWDTVQNPQAFPELNDPEVKVPWLVGRPSFGIALSGGGTRSASASLGELRALHALGWLDQARYLSTNSGGSWAAAPFTYLPEIFDQSRFLGTYVPPQSIVDDVLMAPTDKNTLESAIYHAKLVDARNPDRLLDIFRGDEAYSNFVEDIFLQPFDLNENRFFSSHDEALESIRRNNPDLKADDFYLTRKGRPFLIVVGTVQGPGKSHGVEDRFLIEATPLYVGIRNSFVVSEQGKDEEKVLLGGGYVEPLGYDSYEPEQSVPAGERQTVRLKGKLLRGDLTRNTRYRFTLSDMIGMSSAAPSVTLNDRKIPDIVFPEFRHWAIDRQRVLADDKLRNKSIELVHGDGGDFDNLAILPLLERKVDNILVFINTRTKFPADTDCDQVTTETLVDDLVSLFRPVDGLPEKTVFVDGDAELSKLCRSFAEKKADGNPLVHCQSYVIKDNPLISVSGNNYHPSICWVYLDRTQRWIDALPDSPSEKKVADLKYAKEDFDTFPHYGTFLEKKALLIDLDRERVRALSQLTAWTVFDQASYIAEHMKSADLPLPNGLASR